LAPGEFLAQTESGGFYDGFGQDEEVCDAEYAVREARKTMHRHHQPDLYTSSVNRNGHEETVYDLGSWIEEVEPDTLDLVPGNKLGFGFPVPSTRCACGDCESLKKAAAAIDNIACWRENGESHAVVAAQKAIWRARAALHCRHRSDVYSEYPEFSCNGSEHAGVEDESYGNSHTYDSWGRANKYSRDGDAGHEEDDGYATSGSYDSNVPSPQYSQPDDADYETQDYQYQDRYHGKFLVCDHCRGHGLPCNEAPVCYQCQMSETPCIHRWCADSFSSKDECLSPECRYAHTDHLPLPEDSFVLEDYIILPGNLRTYLIDGRQPRLQGFPVGEGSWKDFDKRVRVRQDWARANLLERLYWGEGTLQTLYCACGTRCPKTLYEKEDADEGAGDDG